MGEERLPEWEGSLLDAALGSEEERRERDDARARRRAVQLAREQAYHRLAVAIDRPTRDNRTHGQLSLFPTDATLFDDAG
jgi:hypothetical protein